MDQRAGGAGADAHDRGHVVDENQVLGFFRRAQRASREQALQFQTMNVRYRPMRPRDVRACVAVIESNPIVGPRYAGALSGPMGETIRSAADVGWLREPLWNKSADAQFGPYAYRSNAAQYFNLVWPVALALGWEGFAEFLDGAATMDRHFLDSDLAENLPLRAAFADQLYSRLRGCQTRAVFAYDERLRLLPSYLQQLEMESNGKSVTADGQAVSGPTAPITWGGVGTDAQHAVFQLLEAEGPARGLHLNLRKNKIW